MHLRKLLEREGSTNCPAGTTFYSCTLPTNNFRGCCSVEACNPQGGCPDATPSSSSTPSSSASLSSASPNSSPSNSESSTSRGTTATLTVTPLPTPALSLITSTVITPTATTTVPYVGAMASATSSSIPMQSSSAKSTSKTSFVPILAGTVSGVVALSIISVLLWFCLRRRRQRKQARESIAKYGLPIKDYVLARSLTPEEDRPKDSGVFAEFGGRYNSPRPATTLPRNLADDSMRIDSPVEAPLPDIEKGALTPPPIHSHPAYHPNPGQSPEIPTYHPGRPIHSPPMMQHPTYHISQLSQHPAFLSGPSTSPRAATFSIPKRTTEVKRQKSSPRAGGRSGPMDITPIIPVIPSGRSELEAEVPASYSSPVNQFPTPMPDMKIQTQYNPAHYTQHSNQNGMRTRGNTQASTYSIPIGLGVNSSISPSQHQYQYQNQHQEPPTPNQQNPNVVSPMSIVSPQSPFHLQSKYSPHLSTTTATSISTNQFSELREGKEKEVVHSEMIVSPLSPERWSGATCTDGVEMVDFNTNGVKGEPVSATGETPSDDFRTWESWAQR